MSRRRQAEAIADRASIGRQLVAPGVEREVDGDQSAVVADHEERPRVADPEVPDGQLAQLHRGVAQRFGLPAVPGVHEHHNLLVMGERRGDLGMCDLCLGELPRQHAGPES